MDNAQRLIVRTDVDLDGVAVAVVYNSRIPDNVHHAGLRTELVLPPSARVNSSTSVSRRGRPGVGVGGEQYLIYIARHDAGKEVPALPISKAVQVLIPGLSLFVCHSVRVVVEPT
jgi:hypothetical protein